MTKIDIQKVDCCDVCFEKCRFSPKKNEKPYCFRQSKW